MSMILLLEAYAWIIRHETGSEERYVRAWERQQYKRMALQREATPRERTGLALGLTDTEPTLRWLLPLCQKRILFEYAVQAEVDTEEAFDDNGL